MQNDKLSACTRDSAAMILTTSSQLLCLMLQQDLIQTFMIISELDFFTFWFIEKSLRLLIKAAITQYQCENKSKTL